MGPGGEAGTPQPHLTPAFSSSETIMFLHQIFYQGLKARISSWPTLVLGESPAPPAPTPTPAFEVPLQSGSTSILPP